MSRWGILATGGVASAFVADLVGVPGAEVVAVGSRTAAAARSFADRFGIARAYGSWAELAADEDLDVVYVATPHSAHHAAALTCLRSGRAVLVEKPFTLDLATAGELVAQARQRNLFLMEAMWTRCNPLIVRMQSLIADGAIGEVTSVHADFGISGPFPAGHRLRARELGGGALLDLGIYPITLAHLVLGMPEEIKAWASPCPEGADQNTGVLFGYACGALAALTCGLVGRTATTATITGTSGRIVLTEPFWRPGSFELWRAGADPEVIPEVREGNGYQHEAAEVQRCLGLGLVESSLVPHAATLEVIGLLDRIREQIGVSYH